MRNNPYTAPQVTSEVRQENEQVPLGIFVLGLACTIILFSIGAAKSPERIITTSFAAICATIAGIPIFAVAFLRPCRRTRRRASVASAVAGTTTTLSSVAIVAGLDYFGGNSFAGLAWWWAARFAAAACLGAVGGFCGALLGIAASQAQTSRH